MTEPRHPKAESVAESKAVIAAERAGSAFLYLRDGDGEFVLLSLGGRERLTLGRNPDNDLPLPFDGRVSGVHAVLQLLGGAWAVEDDGLSRNGTFVNGIRVAGRTRLRDRDWLRTGDTILVFRNPAEAAEPGTIAATEHAPPEVTPAQKRVLIALCGPQVRERRATPASNQEIADECVLSIDGVKSHLKELYNRFGMDDVPQNDKRSELARRALETGVVTEREVAAD
jgi:DNA-binding CsgD family transcriptional regulator